MISVGQIKAARGLLEWNQSDLARASGLHINAINNVERRQGVPRTDTIEMIRHAFEGKGIRFHGLHGVELVPESLEIKKASGPQIIRILTDEMLLSLRGPDDELLAIVSDERLFEMDTVQNDRYYKAQKKLGFRHRIILSGSDAITYAQPDEVRFLPAAVTGKITYQICGDKFVVINWDTPEIVMMRSASLAESFRQQFNYLWEQAKPYPGRFK